MSSGNNGNRNNGNRGNSWLTTIVRRASDPKPEEPVFVEPIDALSLGWLLPLAAVSALGVCMVAYAFTTARDNGTELGVFFYLGILMLFAPTLFRLITPDVARVERVCLLCVTGISLYLVKVMTNPLYFSSFDEFLHWRTADDIARSGHLFTENALLPVSPYYPGLEIVTNALSSTSGMDSFHAGLLVIGVGRLLMMLTLFGLYEQILKSARMASIAVMMYMVNPHLLEFDSQFAYESLALPLAIFVLFAIAPHQWVAERMTHLTSVKSFVLLAKAGQKKLHVDLLWITATGWIALGTLILTHHVTAIYFVAILIMWTIVYGLLRLSPLHKSMLTRTALFGALILLVWLNMQGNPAISYIASFLDSALREMEQIIFGSGSARPLFVTYTGHVTPLWQRIVMTFSVGSIILALPFGLLCLVQRYRTNALACTLGLISLCYPLSQVFRFTDSGAQLTDRAAAFLFVPIALLLAIFIVQFLPVRQLSPQKIVVLTGVLSLVFIGGILLGAGQGMATLPGPYLVGADSRSLEPEGIQDALWVQSQLGPNNRIGTDRINSMLLGTFGDQRIVTSIADHLDVSTLFFAPQFDASSQSLVRNGQIRYLVVDLRMAQALPLNGFYFTQDEPGAYGRVTPVALSALTKFDTVPEINREFDSGNIVLYDLGGLLVAPEKP